MAERKVIDRSKLLVREIKESDVKAMFDLLEEMQWQICWSELCCWYRTHRTHYTVLEYDGQYIGSINLIPHGDKHFYVAFYIMRPEFRYQGLGKVLWNEGLKRARDKTVILASPTSNFEMYAKKGFTIKESLPCVVNVFSCRFDTTGMDETIHVIETEEKDSSAIADYDASIYEKVDRREYIKDWINSNDTTSLLARKDGQLVGFLVATHYGSNVYKIGPLEADSLPIAKKLIKEYSKFVSDDAVFAVSFLESNDKVTELFDKEAEYEVDRYYFLSTGNDCRASREDKIWFMCSCGVYRA